MTEASTPLPAIERRFVAANGLRFGVATCESQQEGGRLALCLHGFPECWRSWIHQFPALAELGYRVWAPDMRGYGETDCPRASSDYAIEHLMDDVAGLIDAAQAQEVVLVGHDWGAIVAWYFAMRRVRELERLVIMNVPHPAAAGQGLSLRQLLRSWYAIFFQIPGLAERVLSGRRGNAVGEGIRRGMVNPQHLDDETAALIGANFSDRARVKAMVDYYRALIRGGGARRQSRLGFPAIETPTLMLWGVNDVALTVGTTYKTHEYVEDLTLRYLPEASHFVQQDAPVLVNRMLRAWLRGEAVPEEGEAEGITIATRA